MSLSNEPSIADLDRVSAQLKELMAKRPDLVEKVKEIRNSIVDMKVASVELEELRSDFERGNITDDNYRVRSKKLRKDYLLAKESINDLSIESLLDEVKENNEKTRLGKAWECIKSNKEKIIMIGEIGAAIVKGVFGTA